jgi:hypothetical protein
MATTECTNAHHGLRGGLVIMQTFKKAVSNKEKTVLVDFYAE